MFWKTQKEKVGDSRIMYLESPHILTLVCFQPVLVGRAWSEGALVVRSPAIARVSARKSKVRAEDVAVHGPAQPPGISHASHAYGFGRGFKADCVYVLYSTTMGRKCVWESPNGTYCVTSCTL
ncbi:hypothetical protein PM082_004327 [Marasmius tenuissimus]|nr:hypothetical protein PM082_004327 [Marasmius tenuissimus]